MVQCPTPPALPALTEGFFLLSLCFCQMPLVCVFEKQHITIAP